MAAPEKSKRPRAMGITFIIAGLFFLFNPIINVLDVLPDAIGFSLLLYGIYHMSDLSEDMAAAFSDARKLLYISGGQLIVMLLLPGMEDKGYSLVFTFVFALAEGGLLLHMFSHIFEGMGYLATRFDTSEKNPIRLRLTETKTVTAAFVVVRAALNILPECTYLSTSDYTGYITAFENFDISNYGTALLMLNLAVTGIFGIVWFIVSAQFWRGVSSDGVFIGQLERHYAENVASDSRRMDGRVIRTGIAFILAGFVLCFDIWLDGVNFAPDFVAALLVAAGFCVLGRRIPDTRRTVVTAAVWGVLDAAFWGVTYALGHSYYNYNVFRRSSTLYMYIAAIILSIAAAAAFIMLIASVCRTMSHTIDRYAGVEEDIRFKKLMDERAKMLGGLHLRVKLFAVTGVVSALSSAANIICMYTWSEYWMINAVIGVAFIFAAISLFSTLREQISARYE